MGSASTTQNGKTAAKHNHNRLAEKDKNVNFFGRCFVDFLITTMSHHGRIINCIIFTRNTRLSMYEQWMRATSLRFNKMIKIKSGFKSIHIIMQGKIRVNWQKWFCKHLWHCFTEFAINSIGVYCLFYALFVDYKRA